MGHKAKDRTDGPVTESTEDIILLIGNANAYPRTCRDLAQLPQERRPFTVLWHTEPLPPPKESGIRPKLPTIRESAKIVLHDQRATDIRTNARRILALHRSEIPDLLLVSTQGRVDFLAEQGIRSHRIPVGYSPDIHGHFTGTHKDIDTLFLGDLQIPRRRRLLRRLNRTGLNIIARGSWTDPSYWGECRSALLNRTKIMLNIQRYPGELSGIRLILGMAAKALVISEPMYKPVPYIEGVHYISTPIEKMSESIRYYLAHQVERERIAEAGHQLITSDVTHKQSMHRMLSLIREGSDARK